MRHVAWWTALSLAGCNPPDPIDTDAPPAFAWAEALAPYANCTLEATYWALHDTDAAAIERYEYDANGVWTRYEWYDLWYLDGELGQAVDRVVDALGREQSARWFNGAGEATVETQTTWDEVGPVSRSAHSPIGAFPDRQVTIEHDAEGRVLTEVGVEAPFDGDPVFVNRFEWESPGRGRGSFSDTWLADRSSVEVGGALREERTRTFDDQGRWVHLDGVDHLYEPQPWVMDVVYDDAGRELHLVSECTTDCWWWDYQETDFSWTCP